MKFKHNEDKQMFTMLHPILIMIYADLVNYAKECHGVDLVVTETITTADADSKLKRTSKSHQQGRALDIRTRGINVFKLNDIINFINNKDEYKKFHYVSTSGKVRLAFLHTGNAEHIHLAIHSRFAIDFN